ncbi:hypothetical protein, partial [Anaerorhabdus sp.]|uniref:hypothetical protein n=1 Tax=Anaerorhabdus sp. TaxID=1872524 RepID=UPI002FCC5D84
HKISNISKLSKEKSLIDLVVNEVKESKLSSLDETANNLILNHKYKIQCALRLFIIKCTKVKFS